MKQKIFKNILTKPTNQSILLFFSTLTQLQLIMKNVTTSSKSIKNNYSKLKLEAGTYSITCNNCHKEIHRFVLISFVCLMAFQFYEWRRSGFIPFLIVFMRKMNTTPGAVI